jgi:hypothetical protein
MRTLHHHHHPTGQAIHPALRVFAVASAAGAAGTWISWTRAPLSENGAEGQPRRHTAEMVGEWGGGRSHRGEVAREPVITVARRTSREVSRNTTSAADSAQSPLTPLQPMAARRHNPWILTPESL